jgi:hypothetical protein
MGLGEQSQVGTRRGRVIVVDTVLVEVEITLTVPLPWFAT